MSVFSSDIIEKELGYDPDPNKNMHLQIKRGFKMVYDQYSPAATCDILTYLKVRMAEFMEFLLLATLRSKFVLDSWLPEWWKGDFLHIADYKVNIIPSTVYTVQTRIRVSWRYTNSLEYQFIDFRIDMNRFPTEYKNWCI